MKNLDLTEIGERIRTRRDELNLSRDKLAEQIGISPKFLSDIELGYRGCSIANLVKISEYLMLSTDYILFGSKDKMNEQTISLILSKCPASKRITLLEIIKMIIESYNE